MLGGHGPGVPTPNYAKAVEVHNISEQPATVSVTYESHDHPATTETKEVGAGQTVLFPEKIVDKGSWQAVVPVKSVTSANTNQLLIPQVHGIVPTLKVTLSVEGHGGLRLNQAH